MYSTVLLLHSWMRWVVIGAGIAVLVQAASGWGANKPWTAGHARLMRIFTGSLDLQVVIGLVLYVALSPFTRVAFSDVGAAMRDSGLRFWLVEHLFGMVVGVALAHVGGVRIRKATGDANKHRMAAIFVGVALVVIVASIPWPGMSNGRPLLRP